MSRPPYSILKYHNWTHFCARALRFFRLYEHLGQLGSPKKGGGMGPDPKDLPAPGSAP